MWTAETKMFLLTEVHSMMQHAVVSHVNQICQVDRTDLVLDDLLNV